ncbi:MAG TPA: YkgJ family cysteine cluster protein [Methanospirillum sp.]|nr:YkgJ family cysteine cluster protein [Methanospirillum sp.]
MTGDKDPGCNQCGKCCLSMRQYMVIERVLRESVLSCRCTLTREQFVAHVPAEDLPRFRDQTMSLQFPKACPFLRSDPEGKQGVFSCIVYSSRPGHCRTFLCKK